MKKGETLVEVVCSVALMIIFVTGMLVLLTKSNDMTRKVSSTDAFAGEAYKIADTLLSNISNGNEVIADLEAMTNAKKVSAFDNNLKGSQFILTKNGDATKIEVRVYSKDSYSSYITTAYNNGGAFIK